MSTFRLIDPAASLAVSRDGVPVVLLGDVLRGLTAHTRGAYPEHITDILSHGYTSLHIRPSQETTSGFQIVIDDGLMRSGIITILDFRASSPIQRPWRNLRDLFLHSLEAFLFLVGLLDQRDSRFQIVHD
jgi:hypothetical protein